MADLKEPLALARRITEVADGKQAENIVLLDTHEVCSFADYFIICSAESEKQIETIHQEVERVLKAEGVVPNHYEGTPGSGWVLLDFGDVILHIFSPLEREFYKLDELWSRANTLVRIQ